MHPVRGSRQQSILSARSRARSLRLIIGCITVLIFSSQINKASTIAVPAGGDLQAALNAAQCGDLVLLQAGATWDTPGPYLTFRLPAKGCTASNPITVQSSGQASLPNGRVAPSDAANMARIRTTGPWAAIGTTASATYWILDGLEVTDNITSGTSVTPY